MIKTYKLIDSLNKEESRNVKILLSRTNKTKDRKDIYLFDYVKKNSPNIDESLVMSDLYGEGNKNSFYRLKNRLQTEINKSLIFTYFNNNEFIHTLHLISLSAIFKSKENNVLAFEYLLSAEKKGIKNEFFSLLDLTYSKLIELSIDSVNYNPQEYIKKKRANLEVLNKINEIDGILATLTYRVKISQNYNVAQIKENKQLLKRIRKISEEDTIKNSNQLQLKIYHSISRLLLQQHDYVQLEEYLKSTLNHFKENDLFNKANHDTKLQMLTYLVNSLFKNNKIKESFKAAENLHLGMLEYDKKLYNKYLIYYYNSLVINYQVTDKSKAIAILEEARNKPELQNIPVFSLFVYLNLSILFFNLNKFKQSKKNLTKLKLHDNFNGLDESLRFKIGILELIIIFELEDLKLFKLQLNTLKLVFKDVINKDVKSRDSEFLILLKEIPNSKGEDINSLISKYEKMFPKKLDSDIINYNHWLKGKYIK